jgi:tRNA pseudouridine55 synthase
MLKKLNEFYIRSENGTIEGMTLPVYKPKDLTSFDIIKTLRKVSGFKKVGHAGTLDPFAEGLLLVAFGRSQTRQLDKWRALPKVYEATGRLGIVTDSQDKTGLVLSETKPVAITKETLEAVLKQFRGDITQLPPMYSAKKVNGQRLYKLARKGQEIERKANIVSIYELELIDFASPFFHIRVKCSAGTYIRTLIHDIGQTLGVGAAAWELRRTQIGHWYLNEAFTIEEFQQEWMSSAV